MNFCSDNLEDSHPNFKRDDPKASCALKREAGKKISKSPISSRSLEGQDKRLGVRFAGIRNGILPGISLSHFGATIHQRPGNAHLDTNFTSVHPAGYWIGKHGH
mmetsp:Transcript_39977/g.96458  ORF Transcript_39977/g.96458 Transcript_39977/m.96458 type:complete len:104 (+) Transcript_39977:122-433(+)